LSTARPQNVHFNRKTGIESLEKKSLKRKGGKSASRSSPQLEEKRKRKNNREARRMPRRRAAHRHGAANDLLADTKAVREQNALRARCGATAGILVSSRMVMNPDGPRTAPLSKESFAGRIGFSGVIRNNQSAGA